MRMTMSAIGRRLAVLACRTLLQLLFVPLILAPTAAVEAQTATKAAGTEKVVDVDWLELLPENERARGVAAAPPPGHNFLDDGGATLPQEMSFAVNPALDGTLVRLPGFVVPLDLDAKGQVTEFFLVPYYGACIHYPPPPPNQIVYVIPPKPFKLPTLTTPYWVTGRLRTAGKTSRVGAAAYTVSAQSMEIYKDP
ncbi:MAG: hypothetical protein RLZZ403_778 [Pseudomonadota bacterium]|jgi:hypothetical protein